MLKPSSTWSPRNRCHTPLDIELLRTVNRLLTQKKVLLLGMLHGWQDKRKEGEVDDLRAEAAVRARTHLTSRSTALFLNIQRGAEQLLTAG